MYSRLVLDTSLFHIEMIKTVIQKYLQKGDAQLMSAMNSIAQKILGSDTHLFSLLQ